ncbi:unnamed protein product [Miscanthus lutarioriparius]|uniref:Uncharacterized protein n=1 Tax=Miscanthus lutarioriparius TaxID=422564 RepID=A0A811QQU9_9POAL|nr:unnamed protein product [Miscanthus lutarioriparius]
MEETVVPLPVDLRWVCDGKFEFEGKTIGRMEGLVMKTLKWRMQCDPAHFHRLLLDKFKGWEATEFCTSLTAVLRS